MSSTGPFPALERFLQQLRSNWRVFGVRDIHDLLQGRRDADFVTRVRAHREQLERVIEEVRNELSGSDHPADSGYIKYLLWGELRQGSRLGQKPEWKATEIGEVIIATLRTGKPDRLVCIPLQGSVSPLRHSPNMYPLAEDVWLLERPAQAGRGLQPDCLIRMLSELLPELPGEIRTALSAVDNPPASELGGLFLFPLLAYHANPVISERGYRLRRYGLPLLALHGMNVANELDGSDDDSFMSFVRPEWGPPRPRSSIVQEWDSLCAQAKADEQEFGHGWRAMFGFWSGIGLGGAAGSLIRGLRCSRIVAYELDAQSGRITPMFSGGGSFPRPPHLLVLPSLLAPTLTKALIDAGDRLEDPTTEPFLRRIGHAITLWERAFNLAQEEDWEVGWMHEDDQQPALQDPDALTLYSTVVLEALFSSRGSQAVSAQIAELGASCLGQSPAERSDLARRLKAAYDQRCDFVHGRAERRTDHTAKAVWLFKIATCCLWNCVKVAIVEGTFTDWDHFIEHLQRRKCGAV